MRGDPKVIEILNEVLTSELTAINQYFIHAKMCGNWGFPRLRKMKWDESVDEMKHADAVIERILYLDGIPNMQRYNPVRVGEDVLEIHKLDLALEVEAVDRLRRGVGLCQDAGDHGTRKLLESILTDEEHAIDELESQLHAIEQIGLPGYLAEQLKE